MMQLISSILQFLINLFIRDQKKRDQAQADLDQSLKGDHASAQDSARVRSEYERMTDELKKRAEIRNDGK